MIVGDTYPLCPARIRAGLRARGSLHSPERPLCPEDRLVISEAGPGRDSVPSPLVHGGRGC